METKKDLIRYRRLMKIATVIENFGERIQFRTTLIGARICKSVPDHAYEADVQGMTNKEIEELALEIQNYGD